MSFIARPLTNQVLSVFFNHSRNDTHHLVSISINQGFKLWLVYHSDTRPKWQCRHNASLTYIGNRMVPGAIATGLESFGAAGFTVFIGPPDSLAPLWVGFPGHVQKPFYRGHRNHRVFLVGHMTEMLKYNELTAVDMALKTLAHDGGNQAITPAPQDQGRNVYLRDPVGEFTGGGLPETFHPDSYTHLRAH